MSKKTRREVRRRGRQPVSKALNTCAEGRQRKTETKKSEDVEMKKKPRREAEEQEDKGGKEKTDISS